MTQAINQNIPASPGLWDQTCNAASNAATWIQEGSKKVAASASDLGSRAWAAISDAVSNIAQFFAYYANIAKEAVVAAKDHFVALPMNVKVVAGVGAVLTAVATYFLVKWCAPAPAAATATATVQTPPASSAAASASSAAAASSAATATANNP